MCMEQIEDPMDDEAFEQQQQKKTKTSMFAMFGGKKGVAVPAAAAPVADPKPEQISGWLEKKNHGAGKSGTFVRR